MEGRRGVQRQGGVSTRLRERGDGVGHHSGDAPRHPAGVHTTSARGTARDGAMAAVEQGALEFLSAFELPGPMRARGSPKRSRPASARTSRLVGDHDLAAAVANQSRSAR